MGISLSMDYFRENPLEINKFYILKIIILLLINEKEYFFVLKLVYKASKGL